MNKIKDRLKRALQYSIHTWIFKCLAIAIALEFLVEILGRHSLIKAFSFVFNSPIVFVYNVSIILFTLLFALFFKRRVFTITIISVLWTICGVVNFVVLGYRVTPFAAIDFMMAKDVLTMLDVYFKKWQIVLLAIGVVLVVALLVYLFCKMPKFEGSRKVKGTMLACTIAWAVVLLMTKFNVKHNIISDDFANLGMAYEDYGFAYCFTNSIIDNGIEKPDDYSKETMLQIKKEIQDTSAALDTRKPNVIVIQLESFFDPKDVEGLTLSEDPVPNFTAYKEEYPSGYFTVPALGAGTANTEFEFLTGMKSSFFGAGEYPYKTTVNSVPVEGLCSVFKAEGYGTYAIHNNTGTFYDRVDVYDEMGFDAFISEEYMYNLEYTSTGWAKDKTLTDDIMKCLEDSKGQDFVYTISVQGHGRYPDTEDSCEDYIQVSYEDEAMEKPFHYYVNQIYEMDVMLGELVKALDEYGEDYVLLLYGDHLPSLDLTEEMLPNSTLFQTEYVMVNNINLKLSDKSLASYEAATRLLDALGMDGGYSQRAARTYKSDVLEDKLRLIAYDMLFGERYLYNGESAVGGIEGNMRLGIDVISIDYVRNEDDHIIVSGENFNTFSTVFINEKPYETVYVDSDIVMVNDESVKAGDEIAVGQSNDGKEALSFTEIYRYFE